MWYEALAMLTASIPPAGAAATAARCRRCCSSHSRRCRFQGRSPTQMPTTEGASTGCPLPGEAWACLGESRGYEAGLTTALLAGERAHGKQRVYSRASPGSQTLPVRLVSPPLPPHSLPRARGQNPPPSLRGRRWCTRDATES